jgi:sterol desaturase/sphingolipid hydroxylase (fatty acid hydroxylase superfamily)
MKLDPVTLATPFFILAVILEIVLARLGKAKANYDWRDARTSLLMGLGSTVAGALTGGLAIAATLWVYQFHLFAIPLKAWWAWVLIFFLEDLCYYVFTASATSGGSGGPLM